MQTSEKIKNLRLELGLNQGQFADLIDVTLSSICGWENGRRNPRIGRIKKMVELAKKHKIKLEIKDFIY